MALTFGLLVPQDWTLDLAHFKDPVEAYETMTRVAQGAEEVGFASIWLVDHLHTTPRPLTERMVERIVHVYASLAQLADVSPSSYAVALGIAWLTPCPCWKSCVC